MKKLVSFIPFLLGIAVIVLWRIFDDSINYYLISVILLILSILPFFISFESSKPSAAELTLIASLVAIAVVSRGAFYLVPQVKPIGAVVVVSGAVLGGKRGYLIGSMSAFISNFIFVQGIWTPFQMAALGLVGLVSGIVFSKIKAGRLMLSIVGFLLCFAVYGVIVDTCSVLVMSGEYSLSSVLPIYLAGVPFNLVFGITTAIFLALFGKSFIKKCRRIIIKYDIIEV